MATMMHNPEDYQLEEEIPVEPGAYKGLVVAVSLDARVSRALVREADRQGETVTQLARVAIWEYLLNHGCAEFSEVHPADNQ